MTRKHFHIHLSATDVRVLFGDVFKEPTLDFSDGPKTATAPENGNEFLVTMLVGDGTYNGVFVPTDELARAASSMDKNPVNLDHSAAIEDEVGFVRQAQMFERALKGILVLNPATAKFTTAKSYIMNRLAAGTPPEVSVGFFADIEENNQGLPIARNITFDHLALVSRGACSPADGCGIGLSREIVTMNEITTSDTTSTAVAVTATVPDPKPCGCAELRAKLAAAEAKLTIYESRELAALTSEAHKLGVPVESTDGVECLTKKLALARAVLAANPAPKEPEAPTRHTATAAASTATPTEDYLRHLSALAGIPSASL